MLLRRGTDRIWIILCASVLLAGCAANYDRDLDMVSGQLDGRVGASLPAAGDAAIGNLPDGVVLEDGVSEREAVAIALWNNARFWADMAQLGFAKAEVYKAQAIPNPTLQAVFPGGPKALETTLSLPIDLLERPSRVSAAKHDLERVANDLVQNGLGLVRDVRLAAADVLFSRRRQDLLAEDVMLLSEIADIRAAEHRAGRISELAARAALAKLAEGQVLARNAATQAETAELALFALLGLLGEAGGIDFVGSEVSVDPLPEIDALLKVALDSRPDLQAAKAAIISAAKAARWEEWQLVRITAQLDGDEEKGQSLQFGPGGQIEIPIFNQNQHGRMRAAARVQQAQFRYTAVRHDIFRGVRAGYSAARSASGNVRIYRETEVPLLSDSVAKAEHALKLGRIRPDILLDARRSLLLALSRQAESEAALRRALAELSYAAGTDFARTSEETASLVK